MERLCESDTRSTLQADVEYQWNEYLIITKREIPLCERNSCNICATLRCLSLLHHTYIKLRHSSRVFADISILIFSTQPLICVRKDFFSSFLYSCALQLGIPHTRGRPSLLRADEIHFRHADVASLLKIKYITLFLLCILLQESVCRDIFHYVYCQF